MGAARYRIFSPVALWWGAIAKSILALGTRAPQVLAGRVRKVIPAAWRTERCQANGGEQAFLHKILWMAVGNRRNGSNSIMVGTNADTTRQEGALPAKWFDLGGHDTWR